LTKTLVVYLMAMPDTPALAHAAVGAGADVIELGFPFSDPLADGPVIRRAGERSLAAGMRTGRCLEVLAETRARVDVPLIPMTYASLFEAYGWERLERDARDAGATSFIVPDLPADVQPALRRVQLVAPTSTDERLKLAADTTDTTGARTELAPSLAPLAERARAATSLPLRAGFGISTPEHARAAAELVDGIVVGSSAVEAAELGAAELAKFVGSLRRALDDVPVHA
jgi:tryptophan synthase alpha chain